MVLKELKELNVKNILEIISQEEIYRYYLPKEFKFNIPFSSPLRLDKIPSFVIGGSNKSYKYKDFATGDTGNCFNFVMQLYNINFNLALIQIVSDFNIRNKFIIPYSNYTTKTIKAEYNNPGKPLHIGEVVLKIKKREFKEYDFNYWNSFGISASYLKLGRIVPISHYFINDIMFIAEKYAYAYIEKKDGKITYKIYQPYSKYKKWIAGGSTNNSSIWELWDMMPETGDVLIVTSSRKDALCIWENAKIPSVALQAESVMPKEVVIKELLRRFKKVFILYDNDYHKELNNGQEMAKKLITKYPELINIMIDTSFKSKDISDLCYNYENRILVKQVINDLIK